MPTFLRPILNDPNFMCWRKVMDDLGFVFCWIILPYGGQLVLNDLQRTGLYRRHMIWFHPLPPPPLPSLHQFCLFFSVFLCTLSVEGFTEPEFLNLKEPMNGFQGINSASLHSLAGWYDNSIPTRFLAPRDCWKITALMEEERGGEGAKSYDLRKPGPL